MHLPTCCSRRSATGVAIACSVVLLAGITPAATASPPASARAAVPSRAPSCTTSRLVVWLDTRGSGTAGGGYYDLELTNLSGHACTLRGYPGVSAVSLSGRQLGRAASRDTARTPGTVTLSSATTVTGLPPIGVGATATVVLKITDVGVYAASSCDPVTAAGLRVYPPNQTAPKVIPFPFVACSRSGPAFLRVQAVQKGVLPR